MENNLDHYLNFTFNTEYTNSYSTDTKNSSIKIGYNYSYNERIFMAIIDSGSNLALIPCIILSMKFQADLDCFFMLLTLTSSFMYHFCESLQYNLIMSDKHWHVLDNIGSICNMINLSLMFCKLNNTQRRRLNLISLFFVLILQFSDPWNLMYTITPVIIGIIYLVVNNLLYYKSKKENKNIANTESLGLSNLNNDGKTIKSDITYDIFNNNNNENNNAAYNNCNNNNKSSLDDVNNYEEISYFTSTNDANIQKSIISNIRDINSNINCNKTSINVNKNMIPNKLAVYSSIILAFIFFFKGLDEHSDYLRIFHSLWHILIGYSAFYIIQSHVLINHEETRELSLSKDIDTYNSMFFSNKSFKYVKKYIKSEVHSSLNKLSI